MIEQDADLVMFVYRDEYYNPEETESAGIAELILAKHRNGATDGIKLAFQKRYAKFADLAAAWSASAQTTVWLSPSATSFSCLCRLCLESARRSGALFTDALAVASVRGVLELGDRELALARCAAPATRSSCGGSSDHRACDATTIGNCSFDDRAAACLARPGGNVLR